MKRAAKKARSSPRGAKVVHRRLVGLRVSECAFDNVIPIVNAVYEETIGGSIGANGLVEVTTKVTRGNSVLGVPRFTSICGPEKVREAAAAAERPDLFYAIQAASVLFQQLRAACLELDAKYGLVEL